MASETKTEWPTAFVGRPDGAVEIATDGHYAAETKGGRGMTTMSYERFGTRAEARKIVEGMRGWDKPTVHRTSCPGEPDSYIISAIAPDSHRRVYLRADGFYR